MRKIFIILISLFIFSSICFGSKVNTIQFTTGLLTLPAHNTGLLYYDEDNKALAYDLNVTDLDLKVGQEMMIRATNKTGVQIDKGKVVYVSGAQGFKPTMSLASATTEIESTGVIGVVAENVLNNLTGFVMTFGQFTGIDTTAFSEGDRVYLSETVTGGITNEVPVSPNHKVRMGIILKSNADGLMLVRVETGFDIDELDDVHYATTLESNQVLQYNASNLRWENNTNLTIEGNVSAEVYYGSGIYLTGVGTFGGIVGGTLEVISLTVTGTADINNLNAEIATVSSIYISTETYSTGIITGNQIADMVYTLPITQETIGQFLSGDGSGVLAWIDSPIAGSFNLYLTTVESDISGYMKALVTPSTRELQTITSSDANTGDDIAKFISEPNFPGLLVLPSGIVELHLHGYFTRTGNATGSIYFEFEKHYGSGQTLEAFLGTSETIELPINTSIPLGLHCTIDDTTLETTDRIGVHVYAVKGGTGTLTINLEIEGLTTASLNLPSPAVSAANFVPYTGALNDINLGSKNFETTGYVTAGSFSGSGAGIAHNSTSGKQGGNGIDQLYHLDAAHHSEIHDWIDHVILYNDGGISSEGIITAEGFDTTGDFNVDGSTTIGGDLIVTGNLSLETDLHVLGDVTIEGTLHGGSPLHIGTGVTVEGLITANSTLEMGSNADIKIGDSPNRIYLGTREAGCIQYLNGSSRLQLFSDVSLSVTDANDNYGLQLDTGLGVVDIWAGTSPWNTLQIGSSTVINQTGDDFDTQIQGNAETNLIYANAGTDRVGIGTSEPSEKLQVIGTIEVDEIILGDDERIYYGTSLEASYTFYDPAGIGLTVVAPTAWYLTDNTTDWNVGIDVIGKASPKFVAIYALNGTVYNQMEIFPTLTEINSNGIDADTKIQGSTEANLVFINAGTDKVGIGTSEPTKKLTVVGDVLAEGFAIGANTLAAGEFSFLDGQDQTVAQASAVTFVTVNTGFGNNELYDMDQHVLKASTVTFAALSIGQINLGDSELIILGEDSDIQMQWDPTGWGEIKGDAFYIMDTTEAMGIGLDSSGPNAWNGSNVTFVRTTKSEFNTDGVDADFQVQGSTEANLVYVDAGSDQVNIATDEARSAGARFNVWLGDGKDFILDEVTTASNILIHSVENPAEGDGRSRIVASFATPTVGNTIAPYIRLGVYEDGTVGDIWQFSFSQQENANWGSVVSEANLEIVANGDSGLGGELGFKDIWLDEYIPLSESGITELSGFTATSIVGSLNELKSETVKISGDTMTGILTMSAAIDCNSNLDVSGTVNFQDTLTVAGITNLNDTVNVDADLTVTGTTNLESSLTVDGGLDMSSGTYGLDIIDNEAVAFGIRENANNYLVFDTTDGAEKVRILKDVTMEAGLYVLGDVTVEGTITGILNTEQLKTVAFYSPRSDLEAVIRLPVKIMITSIEAMAMGISGLTLEAEIYAGGAVIGTAEVITTGLETYVWAIDGNFLGTTEVAANTDIKFYLLNVIGTVESATAQIKYRQIE